MRAVCSFVCQLEQAKRYVAGFGAGPDGRLYVLECLGPKDDSWIDRKTECDWRVLSLGEDGDELEYFIERQIRNFRIVQPLPDGLLLAGSRCKFSDIEIVPNGHVFGFDGRWLRGIVLGDGIQTLQSTPWGEVWVGYFDEGVIGNLGWTRPIGRRGLLRFDAKGNRVFEFGPVSGLDDIVDCYVLNAIGESEAWCYYYTEFSIVHIRDDRVDRHWRCPIRGASEMAVWRDVVAMPNGYKATNWRLLRLLESGKAEVFEEVEFVDPAGVALLPQSATCRGDAIWFVQGSAVYGTSVRDLAF